MSDGATLNFAERVRVLFNPNYLVTRANAVHTALLIDIESKRTAFKAAESNRLNANWTATGGSINDYLSTELTKMRNRSRWLFRNSPGAISGMNAFTSYCVGTGVKPITTVYGKIKKKDEKNKWFFDQVDDDLFNEEMDDLWDDWAVDVDIGSSKSSPESFYDIQELVLRKQIEDGEAFVHAVVDKSNPTVPMYVELFEPESLAVDLTEYNGNRVVMGVELDKNSNRPVAYHIVSRNTNSVSVSSKSTKYQNSNNFGERKRYEAKYIFHIFKKMRPGQVRGYPMFHGVTEKFFQLEEYEDATLTACKIAACMCAFIERPKGMTLGGDFLPGSGSTTNDGMVQDTDGNKVTHLQPGMIATVPTGATPHFTNPQLPGATFGLFTEHIQRTIGAGIEGGLSYEALTRNTSKASYAGGRLATQRDYQGFRLIAHFMNRKWNSPFRKLWTEIAVTAGLIEAPGFFSPDPHNKRDRRHYLRHEWIPPAWNYGVNPKDDVAASRDAMRAGISTLDTECGFVGRDWRTVLRIKAKIKKTAERLGLSLTSDGAISITNGLMDNDQSDEDAENATNGKPKEKEKATA